MSRVLRDRRLVERLNVKRHRKRREYAGTRTRGYRAGYYMLCRALSLHSPARDNDARNKRRHIWRNYLRSAGIRDENA